jgi:hypothetical protein
LILILLIGLVAFLYWLIQSAFIPSNETAGNQIVVTNRANPEAAVPAGVALADANDRLLVWTAPGQNPGEQTAPGQLVFIDGTGAVTPLLDMPAQTSRVMPCGNEATSPDGSHFAFFVGGDAGTIYMMNGVDAPVAVDEDVQALACLGNGTFQFASDNSRFGYVAYEPGASGSEFPDGFLHVYNAGTLAEEYSTDNVVAFDLSASGVAYVSFFTNDDNEADEAAVIVWNGSAEREVATLLPTSEDCKFTSAEVATASDGKLVLVMGHRCTRGDTRTSWQLYVVDPESRSATLASSDFQTGAFAAFSRTNNILFAPDGSTAFFTIPDGVTANTVAIAAVNLSDNSITMPLERLAVMPTLSGGANAFPLISTNGNWLATVVTSSSNDNTVYAWNLADAAAAPITFEAGSQGDTISSMAFTPDGSRLIFVAGGDHGADNSLVALDLATGGDFRIARGSFGQGIVVSPSGTEVALMDWQELEDPQEPSYLNLIVVNVDTSEAVTVFEGGEIVEGHVENLQFAYPLAWRRVS